MSVRIIFGNNTFYKNLIYMYPGYYDIELINDREITAEVNIIIGRLHIKRIIPPNSIETLYDFYFDGRTTKIKVKFVWRYFSLVEVEHQEFLKETKTKIIELKRRY